MTVKLAIASSLLVASTTGAWAQQARPAPFPEEVIQPDRPDVTNGAHIVDIGLMQVEFGGVYTRVASRARTEATPAMVRVGLADRAEFRLSFDGIVSQTSGGAPPATGLGNVQIGTKLRLWADRDETAVVAILPAVKLPTASAAKGLGSGTTDYTALFIVSRDIGPLGHVDVDYGFAEMGAGGHSHFTQHLASVSASVTAGPHWNPYAEFFWLSRNEPNGRAVSGIDAGAIYTVSKRLALDGGLEVGFPVPNLSAFGGVSVVAGNVMGHRGVLARQRKNARKAARRSS